MTERGVRELLLGTWRGRIGLGVLGLFVFVGVFGSALAPDNPDASSLDILAKPARVTQIVRDELRSRPCSARASA